MRQACSDQGAKIAAGNVAVLKAFLNLELL